MERRGQEGHQGNPQGPDPAVLARLSKAENMIKKLDERQQRTEKNLESMQDFMSKRFDEVLGGTTSVATTQEEAEK